MDFKTDDVFQYGFLELLAKRMKPSLYLEFGVREGYCISRGKNHAARSIGVDLMMPGIVSGYEFFHCSTKTFIQTYLPDLKGIELCFIDADHSWKAVLSDFEGVLPYMAPNGLILLHDTFPEDVTRTLPNESGDCYLAASYIRKHQTEYQVEIVTIPVPPGISIIRRRGVPDPWM